MENENKETKNLTPEEMEEKVLQDVSENIREAAAELEDEIAEAEEMAEEAFEGEDAIEGEDAEAVEEGTFLGYDEDGNPIYAEAEEEEEEVVPEPKVISLKLRNGILALVGAAVIGGVLLFLGINTPAWLETAGSSVVPATPLFQGGKTVAKVEGVAVTEADMEVFIWEAAMEYLEENGGVVSNPADFDWSTPNADGVPAEDVVKEKALKLATENILLMKQGKGAGVEWDEEKETMFHEAQMYQLEKEYNHEIVVSNALAQGYRDMDQFRQFSIRNSYAAAITEDIQSNPDNYYPDEETLNEFKATDGATVKHILISNQAAATEDPAAAPAEGAEAATEEAAVDKKALAEETLQRVQAGEDFDALIQELNEDPGQPAEGYTFGPGTMDPAFEEAAFALGLNEVSGIVETAHGYHIIKRIPGEMDLVNYWKSDAKIKTNEKRMAEISVADIVKRVSAEMENFQTIYQEFMEANPQTGMGY